MAKRTAIIDIGSNSARMIVIERTSRFGFHLIEEVKSRVRIGEGAYEHGGILQDFAMERALKALKEFHSIAKALKVKKILTIATSALRDAPNKDHFKQLIKKEIGINIKVIDGDTEALLGGIAAANLLPISNGVTIDIGGGSTELALIKDKKIIETISLNLGTVRLKELFFDKQQPIKEAIKFIKTQLKHIPPEFSQDLVIGIGGTIRALSKAIMAKNNYPLDKLHGFHYQIDDEIKFIDNIIEAPVFKLKKFNIKKDRYDTIKEGSLIFRELLRYLDAKEVITSGVGIREGLFLKDLLRNQNYRFPHNFQPSVRSLLDRFCFDEKRSKCLYRTTKKLYNMLHEHFDPEREYEQILLYAAKLANIGIVVDFYEHHKHSSYMILNDPGYGFWHEELATIATLVRFHKKKLPSKSFAKPLSKLLPPIEKLNWLSFILSLSEAINRDYRCENFEVEFNSKVLTIKTENESYLTTSELMSLEKPAPFAIKIAVLS